MYGLKVLAWIAIASSSTIDVDVLENYEIAIPIRRRDVLVTLSHYTTAQLPHWRRMVDDAVFYHVNYSLRYAEQA